MQKTKKPSLTDSQRTLANIIHVIRTGHPIDSNFHFQEVVLAGQDPGKTKEILERILSGDYHFVDLPEEKIPAYGQLVLVKNQHDFESPFGRYNDSPGEYTYTIERISAALHTRPDSRLLTLLPNRNGAIRYQSPFAYYIFGTDSISR